MIPQSDLTLHSLSWQQQLQRSVRNVEDLLQALQFDRDDVAHIIQPKSDFPVNVPLPYLSRIKPRDINDPLLLQVLPLTEESRVVEGFSGNPVGDNESNLLPGLIHKYQGRVLLVVSSFCAVNCRYCFRRHFPYLDNRPNLKQWQSALEYIAADSSIEEVIFSGGDPLTLVDSRLQQLTRSLADIPHVQTLRIHTRLPVVIPERVTEELLQWLTGTRLKPVMVLHINHANEIDAQVSRATERLRQAGITLLNQSVLLRNVNDNVISLIHLSKALFRIGVLPYYLHMLDKVAGAAHFEVTDDQANLAMTAMREQLPGYLVPRLVREVAGTAYKQPVL